MLLLHYITWQGLHMLICMHSRCMTELCNCRVIVIGELGPIAVVGNGCVWWWEGTRDRTSRRWPPERTCRHPACPRTQPRCLRGPCNAAPPSAKQFVAAHAYGMSYGHVIRACHDTQHAQVGGGQAVQGAPRITPSPVHRWPSRTPPQEHVGRCCEPLSRCAQPAGRRHTGAQSRPLASRYKHVLCAMAVAAGFLDPRTVSTSLSSPALEV